jgi:hypothetical protein
MRLAVALVLVMASSANAGIMTGFSWGVSSGVVNLTSTPNESANVSLTVKDITVNFGQYTALDTKTPRKVMVFTKETASGFDWDRLSSYFAGTGNVTIYYKIDAGSLAATSTFGYPNPGWIGPQPERIRLVELKFVPLSLLVDSGEGLVSGTFSTRLEVVPEPGAIALLASLMALYFRRPLRRV